MPQHTLAEMVRAKYPGVYDDLTDEQLEAAVLAKYPEYGDLPRTPPPGQPATPIGLRENITRAMGLEQERVGSGQDVLTGIGKSLAGTAIGLGELAGSAGLNRLTGATPETFEAARQAFAEPVGTEQQIGKTAGEIGQFFVPASRAAKGATWARAGMEALKDVAVGAGQTGSLVGGVAAGAGSLAGPATAAVAGKVGSRLQETAKRGIVQALGPTKERFKAIAERIAPEVLRRGLRGSRAGLQTQAAGMARTAGRQIDELLTAKGDQVVPTASIVDALEAYKRGAVITRNMRASEIPDLPAALQNGRAREIGKGLYEVDVPIDRRTIRQVDSLQRTLAELGPEVETAKLVALRRMWEAVVDRAGGFAQKAGRTFGTSLVESSEAAVKREGVGAIRKILASEHPDLADLNREFSFWANLRDVTRATEARVKPQSKGLIRAIGMGSGIVAGAASGDDPIERLGQAVGGGILGSQLVRVVQSPRYRLASAQLKNKLAEVLMSGKRSRIELAVGRLAAATGVQAVK